MGIGHGGAPDVGMFGLLNVYILDKCAGGESRAIADRPSHPDQGRRMSRWKKAIAQGRTLRLETDLGDGGNMNPVGGLRMHEWRVPFYERTANY